MLESYYVQIAGWIPPRAVVSDSSKESSAEKPLKMAVYAGLDLQLKLWCRTENQVYTNILMRLEDKKSPSLGLGNEIRVVLHSTRRGRSSVVVPGAWCMFVTAILARIGMGYDWEQGPGRNKVQCVFLPSLKTSLNQFCKWSKSVCLY